MPGVTIKTTKANLNLMARLVDLLSSDMESLERIQENLENDIIEVISRDLSKNGNDVKPEDIGVHWIVTQRSRNSAAFAVELDFSEFKEEGDSGYKTTASLRKYVRDSVLLVMLATKMLPIKATISVWVRGQQGGTYADTERP